MKREKYLLSLCNALLVAGWVICAPIGEVSARGSDLSSEKMLASVDIADLISSSENRETPSDQVAKKDHSQDEAESQEKTAVTNAKKEVFMLDERTVLEEVRYQIASHFEIQGDFRLYFEKPWQDVRMDTPNWEIVMTSFPPQGLRSRFYVSFELWIDGKRNSTWQEGIRCELWVDAYVALQQIDRGTVMREGLVAVKPVDSLSLYQGPVEIGTNLTDYVVINGLKTGDPLFWRDLRERPLIQKNSLIDVVAEEGNMKVTLKGKALEDGVKGQVIRIRNLQSSNDIQAEVIGINQAKVYF